MPRRNLPQWKRGIDPQMQWLFRKYATALDAELLIRQIRSLIRNQSGQLTQSAFGYKLSRESHRSNRNYENILLMNIRRLPWKNG